MATGSLTVDEGTTTKLGTNTITEDAVTKHLSRTVLNTSAGAEIAPLTDTQLRATPVPISGTVTANLSATDNAVLDAIAADTGTIAGDTTSIDAKIPALGQALAAASVPVVLTAAQISTLTPPAAITGFSTEAKQDTIIAAIDGLEGSVDGVETLLNGGLPAALGAGGGLKVDGSGTALPVSLASVPSHAVTNAGTFAVQATPVGTSAVGDGTRSVTTAGTRVQLSTSSVPCRRVIIQAHESNVGTVVIGAVSCVAALVGRRGRALFPTQSESFEISNLNLLYVDSTADGDTVNFYYE